MSSSETYRTFIDRSVFRFGLSQSILAHIITELPLVHFQHNLALAFETYHFQYVDAIIYNRIMKVLSVCDI